MADRGIVYTGQIPLESDFLEPQRFMITGVGKLAEAVLGTSPIVDGLNVIPTTPNSLSVNVTAGQIYTQTSLDSTNYGTMPADIAHQIVKQGILLDAVTVPLSAPATSGFQQIFLIQCNFQERDEGAVVLPYYNAANPSVAWSGPGNSGEQQYKRRVGAVLVQAKAGVPASAGNAGFPVPDSGWVGLAYVLVSNGQSAISASNITPYAPSSRLGAKLPQIGRAVGISATTVSSSVNLTADQAGLVIVDMTAFNQEITIRLPPISATGGTPTRFTFVSYRPTPAVGNPTAARARIVASGTDYIPNNGVIIYAMDHAVLMSDGQSRWHLISQIPQYALIIESRTPQVMASGVRSALNFTTVAGVTPLTWWNPADPGRIVCPLPSARVSVAAQVRYAQQAGGDREITLLAAGVEYGGVTVGAANGETVLQYNSGTLYLNRNDVVQIMGRQTSGSFIYALEYSAKVEILQ